VQAVVLRLLVNGIRGEEDSLMAAISGAEECLIGLVENPSDVPGHIEGPHFAAVGQRHHVALSAMGFDELTKRWDRASPHLPLGPVKPASNDGIRGFEFWSGDLAGLGSHFEGVRCFFAVRILYM
jgi:hypothetical protein